MSLHCPYCEYQCERKNVLSRHLNKYHLDKNEKTTIECQTCKKAYYNLESLRRHLKKRNCEPKITIPESEEQIDNSVFFYLSEDEWLMPDETLIEYIKKQL